MKNVSPFLYDQMISGLFNIIYESIFKKSLLGQFHLIKLFKKASCDLSTSNANGTGVRQQ